MENLYSFELPDDICNDKHFKQAADALMRLSKSSSNWAGTSDRIEEQAVCRTGDILIGLFREKLPAPCIYRGGDGSAYISWDLVKGDFGIEIENDGKANIVIYENDGGNLSGPDETLKDVDMATIIGHVKVLDIQY
jgi:hypothetical protein